MRRIHILLLEITAKSSNLFYPQVMFKCPVTGGNDVKEISGNSTCTIDVHHDLM